MPGPGCAMTGIHKMDAISALPIIIKRVFMTISFWLVRFYFRTTQAVYCAEV